MDQGSDRRRYTDDEVAAIFEAAASPRPAQEGAVGSARGLTLAELQAIGEEVGVPAVRVAEAASALDRHATATARKHSLRMPVTVGRTVELARAPSDREWDLLLTELRATFAAHGRASTLGHIRAWTNGNLHAYIEPTETGHRLRLGTTKGDAVAANRLGILGVLTGLGVAGSTLLFPAAAGDAGVAVLLGGMGVAALAFNALRLPGWARTRDAQMAQVAARAQALLASSPPAPPPLPGESDRAAAPVAAPEVGP
jgi:hypothetical protein